MSYPTDSASSIGHFSEHDDNSQASIQSMQESDAEFVRKKPPAPRTRYGTRKAFTLASIGASHSSMQLLKFHSHQPSFLSSGIGSSGITSKRDHQIVPDYDERVLGQSLSKSRGSVLSRNVNPANTWEVWWVMSPLWRRNLVLLIFLILTFALINLLAAICFLAIPLAENKTHPHVCATESCRSLSAWIASSMDLNTSPCLDFYNFTCGNHKNWDLGELSEDWFNNFARSETDGENGNSVLATLLDEPDPDDVLGQRIVTYYRTCIQLWQNETMTIRDGLKTMVDFVFRENITLFGIQDVASLTHSVLDNLGLRMVRAIGDVGFFRSQAPRKFPDLNDNGLYLIPSYAEKMRGFEDIAVYMHIGMDALEIDNDAGKRYDLMWIAYRALSLLNVITNDGHLWRMCDHDTEPLVYNKSEFETFHLERVYRRAYLSDDLSWHPWETPGEEDNITNPGLEVEGDPVFGNEFRDGVEIFTECWNRRLFRMFKLNELWGYLRAMYGTIWSVRLFLDLAGEVSTRDGGITDYNFSDTGAVTQLLRNEVLAKFEGQQKETRCQESMTNAMGHYPAFRYFQLQANIDWRESEAYRKGKGTVALPDAALRLHRKVDNLVKNVENFLRDKIFQAAESGGLSVTSSRFLLKLWHIFGDTDTSVFVSLAVHEDDPEFPGDPTGDDLEVGPDHIVNQLKWRSFTNWRARYGWRSHNGVQKLIWHKDFYDFDEANIFQFPLAGDSHYLSLPVSTFSVPFWNNDLLVADYAGIRLQLVNAWMAFFNYMYSDLNSESEINARVLLNNSQVFNGTFREATATDSEHKSCKVLTYKWTHPEKTFDDNEKNAFALTNFDSNFLAFRHGNFYHEVMDETPIFPIYVAWKAMLLAFDEDMERLREPRLYHTMNSDNKKKLRFQKLIQLEQFDERQLFFILGFRQLCRSRETGRDKDRFNAHYAVNRAALSQLPEFQEAFFCPPNSPMTPTTRCFQ